MTTVVKIGGERLDDPGSLAAVARALAARRAGGERLLVVHGGGPRITRLGERLGLRPRFAAGLRVTDAGTMELVEMVLTGVMAPLLVGALQAAGAPAAGLSGRDGPTILAEAKGPREVDGQLVDLGRVGTPVRVDTRLVEAVLGAGQVPVLSPVGADGGGGALNVNADEAAAWVAVALGARSLEYWTGTAGVLDGGRVVAHLDAERARSLIATGVIQGGMRPKVEAALWAREHGVERVSIGDADERTEVEAGRWPW